MVTSSSNDHLSIEKDDCIALSINNLTKSYHSVKALDHLTFQVKKGELYGIIGPDGAGKTTLFRILTTLLLADEGNAKVMSWDIVADYKMIRHNIGYMPGKFSLYQDLSVEENINFFARLFDTSLEENYNLVADIYKQIEPFKKRKAGKLSGGMKQKLALCCALIHKPLVLFLDEPTTGVDPVSRREFWEMLIRLKKEGITIIVSTPYMDEAAMCDRIALIQHGQFMDIDSPEDIIKKFPHHLYSIKSNKMHSLLNDIRTFSLTSSCFSFGECYHVTFSDDVELRSVYDYLTDKGHGDVKIEIIKPNVEDCFMLLSANSSRNI